MTLTITDKRMLKFFRKHFEREMMLGLKIKVGEYMQVSEESYDALILQARAVECERLARDSITATREQIRAIARECKTATRNGNRVAVFFDGTCCEQVSRSARIVDGQTEWPILLLSGNLSETGVREAIAARNECASVE